MLVFILLRPLIDFNANSPIKESASSVETKIRLLLEEMGVSPDTVNITVRRDQKFHLYQRLTDSLQLTQSAAQLQKNGIPLSVWNIQLIGESEHNIQLMNDNYLTGLPSMEWSDLNQLISLRKGDRYPSLFRFPIDSVSKKSEKVLEQVFGFSMENYSLDINEENVTEPKTMEAENTVHMNDIRSADKSQQITYSWTRKTNYSGPKQLIMQFKPEWRPSPKDSSMVLMANFNSFSTVYLDKDVETSNHEPQYSEVIYFLISITLLAAIVFGLGIRLIFKGLVEWKRGFIVLFIAIMLMSIWRGLFLLQNSELIQSSITTISTVFNLLFFSLIIGVYSALGYMTWETFARKSKHRHIPLLDSLWRGQLLIKDFGRSILYSYAVTGVIFGMLAIVLIGIKNNFAVYDSQFGFTEATSVLPFLTITLNALGIVLFGFLGQIALPLSFLQFKWKNTILQHVLSILLISVLASGAGRFIATPNTIWMDIVMYLFILIPVYFAYIHFGFITAAVSWWLFAMGIFSMNFFALDSSFSIIQFLLLLGVMTLPAVFGIVAYYYGYELDQKNVYIPEYEERLTRQLRVEKEIEIARESQFELLPKNTPELPEAMICGFFIPSFEVGGDYYDYFIKYDDQNVARSLAVAMADVSGKAMKAAIHAVHTSGLLLARFQTDLPEKVLTAINPFIFDKTDRRTFITGITAEYFFESKRLRLSNAGHCLPILKRKGKSSFIETPAPKFPLGIRRSVEYQAIEIQLEPGDVVLFYSDGLPEAQNTKGDRIGFDAILTWMDETITENHTSSDICQQIKRKVQTFSAYQMADDTTIVALKIT